MCRTVEAPLKLVKGKHELCSDVRVYTLWKNVIFEVWSSGRFVAVLLSLVVVPHVVASVQGLYQKLFQIRLQVSILKANPK